MVKHELGSEAWVDLTREYLEQHVPALPTAAHGQAFAVSITLTDPPAHLDDGTGRCGYWVSVVVPKVEVGCGLRDDLPNAIVVETDYQEALPHTREIVHVPGADEQPLDTGLGDSAPPAELTNVLAALHNHVAERTA